MNPATGHSRQSGIFLFLYALAWAGGSIAYVPLLTILLPARISDLAGAQAVDWLAYTTFVGAIVASLANIGFGWLSDIVRNRRVFVALGLGLSCTLLVLLGQAEQLATILAILALWQLALNMMLAPLSAWAGDCVPDNQKGMLGGLLCFAPAVGALAGTFVTLPGLADSQDRLWLVAIIVALCVLPALAIGRPRSFPELLSSDVQTIKAHGEDLPKAQAAVRMWFARLLVQIAEAALFAYLLLWFRSLSNTITDNEIALVFSLVMIVAIPLAIMTGRWADKRNRPIFPLAVCAALVAAGLLVMGFSSGPAMAIAGYLLFGIAGTIFLSLHSAQTLRVLPRPERRGRDLGIFNLTNTVPSLIMPWLTLALVPVFGFSALFILLAVLAGMAFLLLFSLLR